MGASQGHPYRFLSSIKRLSLAEYFRLFVCAVLSWQFTLRMLMPPIRLSLLTSSGFIDYERSFFRSVTHLDLGDVKDMSLGLLQPILDGPIRQLADQNNVSTVPCSIYYKDR